MLSSTLPSEVLNTRLLLLHKTQICFRFNSHYKGDLNVHVCQKKMKIRAICVQDRSLKSTTWTKCAAHLGCNFADQIWNVWRDAGWKMNYQLGLKGTAELSPCEFQPLPLTRRCMIAHSPYLQVSSQNTCQRLFAVLIDTSQC